MSTGITDVEWLDAKVCELSKALKYAETQIAVLVDRADTLDKSLTRKRSDYNVLEADYRELKYRMDSLEK